MLLKKLSASVLATFMVVGMCSSAYTDTETGISVSAVTSNEQKVNELMDKFGVSSKASKKAKLEAIVKAVDSLECESTSVGDTWEELITGTSASVEGKNELVQKMCGKVNIDTWQIDTTKQLNGGGESDGTINEVMLPAFCMNVMAVIDDDQTESKHYYQCDMNISEPSKLIKRTSLWSYTWEDKSQNTISIYHYDGRDDTLTGTMKLPSTIDGHKVVRARGAYVLSTGGEWETSKCNITKLEIPEGYVRIDSDAFSSVGSNLAEVVIPASLTNICRAPFSNNPKLKKFTVSTGNKYYCSDKGILYNKAKTVLLSAPSVESVNLLWMGLPATAQEVPS